MFNETDEKIAQNLHRLFKHFQMPIPLNLNDPLIRQKFHAYAKLNHPDRSKTTNIEEYKEIQNIYTIWTNLDEPDW